MPAAKPKKPTTAKAKAPSKVDADANGPMLNGIPLRRKSVWAIDTESRQFRAARKRDAEARERGPPERDSMQFVDAVLAEKDVQKWWN